MRKLALIACGMLSLGVAAAAAQEADARYSLEKSGDRFVRLDKQTGQMSICEDRAGQLVCQLAADDRDAFDSEMDRLQGSVETLEKRVTALESPPKATLPSEGEFDQTMDYMQRFFRSFMDTVKEFDRDLRGAPTDDGEQRT